MNAAKDEPLDPGQRVGRYRVVRTLGRGAMGAVYEVEREEIGQRLAMKVLHHTQVDQPELAARLRNEWRTSSRVPDPGLVLVFDQDWLDDGRPYLIMEYLVGPTLRDHLRDHGALAVPRALRLCHQIAAALAAAHTSGVIHRDLKPANIMLVKDPAVSGGERARVLDFGIAKVHGEDLTMTGVIVGTPAYMAPEQWRSTATVDGKVDVYALGIILYQMLSGRPPFVGATDHAYLLQHMNHTPPPLPPSVPRPVAALVARMMARSSADRPAIAEVVSGLAALLAVAERPPLAQRYGLPLALCTMGAVLNVLGVAWFVLGKPGDAPPREVIAPPAPALVAASAAPPTVPVPATSAAAAPAVAAVAAPVAAPAPAVNRRDGGVVLTESVAASLVNEETPSGKEGRSSEGSKDRRKRRRDSEGDDGRRAERSEPVEAPGPAAGAAGEARAPERPRVQIRLPDRPLWRGPAAAAPALPAGPPAR